MKEEDHIVLNTEKEYQFRGGIYSCKESTTRVKTIQERTLIRRIRRILRASEKNKRGSEENQTHKATSLSKELVRTRPPGASIGVDEEAPSEIMEKTKGCRVEGGTYHE